MNTKNLVSQFLPDLNVEMQRVMKASASPDAPDLLYGMLGYHVGWLNEHFEPAYADTGKHVRPTLTLLCCAAQGGDWHLALPAASAVEFLHNFTLIHDDVEDHDLMRRGRRTLWALWGVPQAVNAGDALFAISYKALLRLDPERIPSLSILRALTRYSETILQITEGQCEDIGFESVNEISEARYLSMIEKKTAVLIGLACELGGIIAGSGTEACSALRNFGHELGMAFQMQDDILGIWGDTSRTGKAVGSDIVNRKKSLPLLHGMSHSVVLRDLLTSAAPPEHLLPLALCELEQSQSRAYVEVKVRQHFDLASQHLEASGCSGAPMADICQLMNNLIDREK